LNQLLFLFFFKHKYIGTKQIKTKEYFAERVEGH